MSMIQWLNEALERKYFTEDYEADRKKYTELVGADKRLTPEEFDKCCNADPTYKEGSNKSGSYLTWIIKRYTDFRKSNPSGRFDFTSCTDDLRSFNEIVTHKLFLKGDDEKHDINYFTSLEALDKFVKSKEAHKKESGKQQQRNQNATTIKIEHTDPDLVFENDRCQVWVPYSYETSRQLGGDTHWCTAASTRGNWDSYSKEGPLFIMIMKDDPTEKYQFFFETTKQNNPQFMDRDNHRVGLSRFPEMQMPWVDEARDTYHRAHDEVIVKQLKSILNSDGAFPEDKLGEVGELIDDLYDEALVSEYSDLANKEYLRLFYDNLTPTLTSDSPSIEYLKQCVGKVCLTIPDIVTSIGERCFYDYTTLKSISIPGSVTSIGDACFDRCKSLQTVNMPEGVTSLGKSCFCGCYALRHITLPNSITSMGEKCFAWCINLESIDLPEGITSLWDACFARCLELKSITIPNRVRGLGGKCFLGCCHLKSITLPDTARQIEHECFSECTWLATVYYGGSEKDRAGINIGECNGALLGATWHYNYKG